MTPWRQLPSTVSQGLFEDQGLREELARPGRPRPVIEQDRLLQAPPRRMLHPRETDHELRAHVGLDLMDLPMIRNRAEVQQTKVAKLKTIERSRVKFNVAPNMEQPRPDR